MVFYALDCGQCIYVGRTTDFETRMACHVQGGGSAVTASFIPFECIEVATHILTPTIKTAVSTLNRYEMMYAAKIAADYPAIPVCIKAQNGKVRRIRAKTSSGLWRILAHSVDLCKYLDKKLEKLELRRNFGLPHPSTWPY